MKNTNEFQIVFDKNLSSMVTLVDLSEILPEKGKTQLLGEKIAVLLQMSISFDDVDAALSACNQLLTNYKKAEILFLARNEHKNAQNYRSKIEQIEKIISFIDSTIIPTRQSLDDKINDQLVITSTIEEQIALGDFSGINNNKEKLQALRNNQFHPNAKISVHSNELKKDDEVINFPTEEKSGEFTKQQAEAKIKKIFSEYYPHKLNQLDDKIIISLLEKESFSGNELNLVLQCCSIGNIFDKIVGFNSMYITYNQNDTVNGNIHTGTGRYDLIKTLQNELMGREYTLEIQNKSMQLLKLNYIYDAIIQFIEEKYPNQHIIALKSLKSKNNIIVELFKEIENLEKNNKIKFG